MTDKIVQQPPAQAAQEKFGNLPTADTERSTFDMSHPWKGTVETNGIVPILTMEILPADTISIQSTAFLRLATPLKPIMDNISTDLHYLFCPNRLVWDNWQFFMGEREDPDDDPTTVTVPQILLDLSINKDTTVNNLPDYFGLPLHDEAAGTLTPVNALPFRCYQKIYNDWYRNQNLEQAWTVPTDDGPDSFSLFGVGGLRIRYKRGDYFTKALPWPQKGDPVFLPLGTSAPVVSDFPGGSGQPSFLNPNGDSTTLQWSESGENSSLNANAGPNPNGTNDAMRWNNTHLEADLTEATAATINDIRTAFQIQRLLERDARGGTRYIEILLSHFNVQSPDFRLQRPEYISGGSARIMINPIASTVESTDVPQGNLAAVGTGVVTASMNHSFTEHGWLFCLMSSRVDLTYQRGMDRMWSRQTRYDYYWPALSHLGEQIIRNEEIYFQPVDPTTNTDTWGYQERYAEYRYQPGRICGNFRSIHPESLDVWHLSEDFDSLPNLNANFLLEDPPIDRVVAVPSEPDLLVDVWHKVNATRAMPVYAVPGMVDHF